MNLLKYLYTLATSSKTRCRIISFLKMKKNEKMQKVIYMLIWMALLMFAKWWKFTTKKTLN